jgi:hypothetical protein
LLPPLLLPPPLAVAALLLLPLFLRSYCCIRRSCSVVDSSAGALCPADTC